MKKGRYIELDKKRKFVFNLNAMVDFEEETGTNLMAVGEEWSPSIREVRALLWAGLNQGEDITIEEAGNLITMENITEVTNALTEAIENSMPESEVKEVVTKGKNKKSPTG